MEPATRKYLVRILIIVMPILLIASYFTYIFFGNPLTNFRLRQEFRHYLTNNLHLKQGNFSVACYYEVMKAHDYYLQLRFNNEPNAKYYFSKENGTFDLQWVERPGPYQIWQEQYQPYKNLNKLLPNYVYRDYYFENCSPQPFGKVDDLQAAGLKFWTQEAEVIKLLGKPLSQQKYTPDIESLGFEYRLTYSYPFGRVDLGRIRGEDKTNLYKIIITSPAVTGPRGTRVGDKVKTVLNKFYRENNKKTKSNNTLYNFEDRLTYRLSGELVEEDGKLKEIVYDNFGVTLAYKINKDKVETVELGFLND